MHTRPIFSLKLQELVISERLSDISSPEIQRMVKAYEKKEIYGLNTTTIYNLGRLSVGCEDAEIEPPDA